MPLSLTFASLWVVMAAVVAMLPMRWQYAPGLVLLISSIPLLVMIGRETGWPWVAVMLGAVLSMYRRPLGALARHLLRRFGKGAA